MNKIIWIMVFISVGAIANIAYADETVDELKAQIEALQMRVDQLEQERATNVQNQAVDQWDPFAEMERMQAEMNAIFDRRSNGFRTPSTMISQQITIPANDMLLHETEEGYEIRYDTSGMDEKEIDIKVGTYSVTLTGQYSANTENQSPNAIVRSSSFSSFTKTIPLPTDADTTKMETRQEGNTLILSLPRKG